MNPPDTSPDPRADERASYWAARLEGSELSAADQSDFDAWLSEHSSHRALLAGYCQFSADLEASLPALAQSGAVELPQEIAPRRRRLAPWFTLAGLAVAGLAAAAVVVLVFWPLSTRVQSEVIATAVAQRQSLTLADGTRAELNAQTSLQIELGATERRVRLAGGEAFFTVTKDANRPFVVETPAGSVRVTGTVFDVRSEATSPLEVLVVEGSVQVRSGDTAAGGNQPVRLAAKEKLTATSGAVKVRTLSPRELDDALAWRRGQIVFNGEPLSTALARFARYHGRGFTAAPQVAQLAVGGRYSLDDLDGFLSALEVVLPVRVTRDLSGMVHVDPLARSSPSQPAKEP